MSYPRNIYIAIYLLITYLLYQNAEFIDLNFTTNYDDRTTVLVRTLEMNDYDDIQLTSDCMYVYALNAICTPLTRTPSFQGSLNAPRIIDPYSNAKCNLKSKPQIQSQSQSQTPQILSQFV